MKPVETWLDNGKILAFIQEPAAGAAHTGVVICPPLGQDHMVAYRTLRLLSDRLAEVGIASVRFDYPGFGDSTVTAEPGCFLEGTRLAAEALRDRGCHRIIYLGLASGSLIASAAATGDPASAGLVLWDPPASGKEWLRRARALYAISVPVTTRARDAENAEAGAMVIVGAELSAATADYLKSLVFDNSASERMPVLIALRTEGGSALPSAFLPQTGGEGGSTEVRFVAGHPLLLDASSIIAQIPESSVEAVVQWAEEHSHADQPESSASAPDCAGLRNVEFADSARFTFRSEYDASVGAALEERLIRIGPHGLFAIETRPVGDVDGLPGVILHNGSAEHRIGASRYQVELARELAVRGIRAVRVDRRGTGESGEVRAGEENLIFTQEWLDDGAAVIRHLGLDRSHTGVIGMSIGGWMGLNTDPDTACFLMAINQNDYRLTLAAPGDISREVRAEQIRPAPLRPVVAWMKRVLPYPILVALARAGRMHLVEPALRDALVGGMDVTLLLGPVDLRIFTERHGEIAVDHLRNTPGKLTVLTEDFGDHALFSPGIRERAKRESIAAAERAFGLRPTAGPLPAERPGRRTTLHDVRVPQQSTAAPAAPVSTG